MNEQRARPSGWFYLVPVILVLFGCMAAAGVFGASIAGAINAAVGVDSAFAQMERVAMPGSAQLALNETGSYDVFYEYRTTVDGAWYSTSPRYPDMMCELQCETTGKNVRLIDVRSYNSDYEVFGRTGRLFMRFDIDEPGDYVLSCNYAHGEEQPEVILAVGAGVIRTILGIALGSVGGVAGSFILVCGAFVVALLAAVVIAVMRYQSGKRAPAETG